MSRYRISYKTVEEYDLVVDANDGGEARRLFDSGDFALLGYIPRDMGGQLLGDVEVEELDV